jgi:hypothetical protein
MLRKGDRDRILDLALRPRPAEVPFAVVPEPEKTEAAIPSPRVEPRPNDKLPEAPAEAPSAQGSRLSPPLGTFVAAGVGVVALSSFAYFGITASNDAADLRRECKPNCPVDQVDAVRSKLVVANVSLGVGVVALGVAGVLWLVRGSSAPKPATAVTFDVLPVGRGEGAQVLTTISAP